MAFEVPRLPRFGRLQPGNDDAKTKNAWRH